MDIRERFGRNVRETRLRAGVTQARLAERLGVDRAHVSSMERGKQNVTLLTLWHVSQALDVEPADLLL